MNPSYTIFAAFEYAYKQFQFSKHHKVEMQNTGTVTHNGLTFKLLYSRQKIESIISNLAKDINSYYSTILQDQKHIDLVIVCVLKGAFMFFSQLVKDITHQHKIEFIKCSSYKGLQSTGQLNVELGPTVQKIKDKHVLIVQDMHDTGHTLKQLVHHLSSFNPKTIDTAVLVKRPDKPLQVDLKFCGLVCDDFIIGYGLDYNEWGRHYPQIYQKI